MRLEIRYLPLTIAVFEDVTGLSSREVDHNFVQDKTAILEKHYPKWMFQFAATKSFLRKHRKNIKKILINLVSRNSSP